MKIQEQAKDLIETLPPSDIIAIYDIMLGMQKRCLERNDEGMQVKAYQKVRESLNGCIGSLSDDIIRNREDRI